MRPDSWVLINELKKCTHGKVARVASEAKQQYQSDTLPKRNELWVTRLQAVVSSHALWGLGGRERIGLQREYYGGFSVLLDRLRLCE